MKTIVPKRVIVSQIQIANYLFHFVLIYGTVKVTYDQYVSILMFRKILKFLNLYWKLCRENLLSWIFIFFYNVCYKLFWKII